MTFTFKKGNYRAWPWYWLRWWPLLFNPVKITRKVTFLHNSKYWLPGIDQQDHNKLFGVGFLNPLRNSARFGWRYNPDTGNFIISAFTHIKGVMDFKDLCEVPANTSVTLTLVFGESGCFFRVFSPRTGYRYHSADVKPKLFGILLGPWFGGNRPAPTKLKLELKK